MANGHLVILERLVVDGHAKRRADLVLPGVALSDIAAVVEERAHSSCRLQTLLDPLGHFHHIRPVAGEWNDSDFDRREVCMQMQNRPFFPALQFLFLVSVHQKASVMRSTPPDGSIT